MTAPTNDAPVTVEQCDRDGCADFELIVGRINERDAERIRAGDWDETKDVLWFARHRLRLAALASAPAGVIAAVRGITDDYMTSEAHHPGYVLIPTARFDLLRQAEASLASAPAGEPDRYANDDAAKTLYDSWSEHPGWVPWVDRGNSAMQERARREVSL